MLRIRVWPSSVVLGRQASTRSALGSSALQIHCPPTKGAKNLVLITAVASQARGNTEASSSKNKLGLDATAASQSAHTSRQGSYNSRAVCAAPQGAPAPAKSKGRAGAQRQTNELPGQSITRTYYAYVPQTLRLQYSTVHGSPGDRLGYLRHSVGCIATGKATLAPACHVLRLERASRLQISIYAAYHGCNNFLQRTCSFDRSGSSVIYYYRQPQSQLLLAPLRFRQKSLSFPKSHMSRSILALAWR